jgi:ammonia channel protein AmtB
VWRAPAIDLQTVMSAVIAGLIVGLLVYWLLGMFSGRLRG